MHEAMLSLDAHAKEAFDADLAMGQRDGIRLQVRLPVAEGSS